MITNPTTSFNDLPETINKGIGAIVVQFALDIGMAIIESGEYNKLDIEHTLSHIHPAQHPIIRAVLTDDDARKVMAKIALEYHLYRKRENNP